MELFLSLETCQKLKEWGCNIITGEAWNNGEFSHHSIDLVEIIFNVDGLAEKFFGKITAKKVKCECGHSELKIINRGSNLTTDELKELVYQNKIKEAEDYFMKHTIFNPNNK